MNEEQVVVQEQEVNDPGENRDFEAEARRQGWEPQEDWDGPQDKWVDAKTFVERGESILPILRKNYKELQKELKQLNEKLESATTTNKKFGQYHKQLVENLKKQHEIEVTSLKGQMRQAVVEGDTEKYDQLEAKMAVLEENKPATPVVEEDSPKSDDPMDTPVRRQWEKDNPWYGKDQEMTAFAYSMGSFLAATRPGLSQEEALKEILQLTKDKYPEKFGNQRRNEPGAVLGGESYADGGPKKGKKTYDQLPADAKAACDQFVAEGLLTKEQFIKDYQWE